MVKEAKNQVKSKRARVAEWQTRLPAGRRAKGHRMYYVYVLSSVARKYIYVGLTDNVQRRTAQHNGGKELTTRSYAPFKTILVEQYNSRADARAREKYLKSGAGKEYLKSL